MCLGALLAAQMPDPKQMSGTPLPVGDLAPGTVTARVIRGQLSNPIVGQTVELTGAGATKTAKTDEVGRATFTGLTPGTQVTLSTTVGAERVESKTFDVPAVGGIRVMLVATDTSSASSSPAGPPAGGPPSVAEPALAGTLVFGPETRFVVEMGDDALNVFNMVQITNPGTRAVTPSTPMVFNLPAGAVGVGLLDASSKNAVAAGGKVTVNGPFAPGATLVQFAYSLPLGSDTITIDQNLPATLPQVVIVVQKVGAMQLTSPQTSERREMTAEGGTYLVAQGGAVPPGQALSFTISGLPSRPSWPRTVAVALAGIVIAAGAYGAWRRPRTAGQPLVKNLQNRREKLFTELAEVEALRRAGSIDAEAYASRRESLVTALEDLYRGLDREVA